MKVTVTKTTFCYEHYVVFNVFNECGKLIDNSFEYNNTYNANNEFRAFARLNNWEIIGKIEKI